MIKLVRRAGSGTEQSQREICKDVNVSHLYFVTQLLRRFHLMFNCNFSRFERSDSTLTPLTSETGDLENQNVNRRSDFGSIPILNSWNQGATISYIHSSSMCERSLKKAGQCLNGIPFRPRKMDHIARFALILYHKYLEPVDFNRLTCSPGM